MIQSNLYKKEVFEHISDYKMRVFYKTKEYCIWDIHALSCVDNIPIEFLIRSDEMFGVYEKILERNLIEYSFDRSRGRGIQKICTNEIIIERGTLDQDLPYEQANINKKKLLEWIKELYEQEIIEVEFSYCRLAEEMYEGIKWCIKYNEVLKGTEHKYHIESILSLLYLWYGDPRNDNNLVKAVYIQTCQQPLEKNETEIRDYKSMYEEEEEKVSEVRRWTKERRQKKLQEYPVLPAKILITTSIFKRNPYVKAEVLERANGICERCGVPAPFMKKTDGTPYLQVHHRIPLANGGEDTVENAVALCPNCHMELHHG